MFSHYLSYLLVKIEVLEDNNITKRQRVSEYLKKLEANDIVGSVKLEMKFII